MFYKALNLVKITFVEFSGATKLQDANGLPLMTERPSVTSNLVEATKGKGKMGSPQELHLEMDVKRILAVNPPTGSTDTSASYFPWNIIPGHHLWLMLEGTSIIPGSCVKNLMDFFRTTLLVSLVVPK